MAAVCHLGFIVRVFGPSTKSIWWSLSLCGWNSCSSFDNMHDFLDFTHLACLIMPPKLLFLGIWHPKWRPAPVFQWSNHLGAMCCGRGSEFNSSHGPGRVRLLEIIFKNNSYAHDDQGDNPGQTTEGSTVSSINWPLLTSWLAAVKVLAALTWAEANRCD